MQKFIYRDIQEKDYDALEKLLDMTGYFKKITPNNKVRQIVLQVYLRSCLEDSTFTKVVEHEGQVIGIVCGRNNKHSKKVAWTPYTAGILSRLIYLHLLKEGRKTLKAHRDFSQNYKELMGDKEQWFDGELTLLIVDKQYRRVGIGKTLIHQFLEYMKKTKAKNFYLLTDTMCQYTFYDHQGFRKIGKQKVNGVNELKELEIYLYDKGIEHF